ncbi:MAG TPA: IPT/TIG domain-containing protein [Thermoanaerobaculia bacterium]
MRIRQSKSVIALLAVLALFTACKGESPTAPPPTTGPGGGSTPPTGATITLAVANPSPVAGSSTTVTATVTVGGQPAPNGTAVEFVSNSTSLTLDGAAGTSTIKTTTGGTTSVTVTSTVAGTYTVTAFVGSTSQSTTITFRAPTTVPTPPSTAPTITSVSPLVGRPTGGEQVTIRGTNLRGPVRVVFDFGGGIVKDALILSATETQIVVMSPPIDLAAAQTRNATIRVFTQVGTATETVTSVVEPFVYQSETLTPRITTLSPASGRPEGGTEVAIIGDGFQGPVQVFFGAAEAQVLRVEFDRIIVVAPPSRNTSTDGTGPVSGPVPVTVINVNSATRVTLADAFRYTPNMQITAVRPLIGPSTGGTDVTIDGVGFEDPVQVLFEIGGGRFVEATVIRVSGTQIVVRTLPTGAPCSGGPAAITVRNVSTAATATAPNPFTFVAVSPTITAITGSPVQPGGSIAVTVANPGVGPLGTANVRFTVNGVTIIPSPNVVTNGSATQTFTVAIPTSGFTFPLVACTTGSGTEGTRLGPVDVAVAFNNVTTGCLDTVANGVRVTPDPATNPCLQGPVAILVSPAGGACAAAPNATVAPDVTTSTNITIRNTTDARPLNITGVTVTGANASEFSVQPTSASNIAAGASQNFQVNFNPSTVANGKTANVTFTTNSTVTPTITVCVTGNGT